MSKKKIMSGVLFLLIFSVLTAVTYNMGAMKPLESLWNLVRTITLNIYVSLLIFILIMGLLQFSKIRPFINKMYRFRDLLYQLVRRDFTTKYKQSILGVLWSLLNPLGTMLILTIVFSNLFRFEIESYPVYLLSGQVIFTFFSEATNMGMSSLVGASSMLRKVNLPKYIFPLSKVMSSMVNLFFSLIALFLVMIVTEQNLHLSMLLAPIVLLYVFFFTLGVSLILASLVVFFRDINYLYGLFLTGITYLTPIFYPEAIIPESFRWMLSINPLYHYVGAFRNIMMYGIYPTVWQHFVCISLALLSMSIGLFIFYRKQDSFILYL